MVTMAGQVDAGCPTGYIRAPQAVSTQGVIPMGYHRYRPSFESLECRLTPGVCTVQFFSGLVVISGGSLADSVTLSQPSPGRITLKGGLGTTFRYGIVSSSTLSLGSLSNPVRNLTANLNTGNDSFTFDETQTINLAGSVTLNLGAGTDFLSQFGTNRLRVGGNLIINHGTGDASITLTNINVAGSVSMTLGSGINETIKLNATPGAVNNVIGGQLNINTNGGAKTIWVDTTNVTGPTLIYGGHNATGAITNAIIYIDQIDDGVALVKLQGGFIYNESPTTTGNDTIGLFDGTTVGNSVRITTYGPSAFVGIAGTTIMGATTINQLGGGFNTIALSAFYHDTFFNGVVFINNPTSVANQAVWLGIAGANMTLNNGIVANLAMGNDTVTIGGSGGLILGPGGSFTSGPGNDEWDCDPLHHTGIFVFTNFELPAPPIVA
jgi:hypothetical protein